jgi:hypothetical protein
MWNTKVNYQSLERTWPSDAGILMGSMGPYAIWIARRDADDASLNAKWVRHGDFFVV